MPHRPVEGQGGLGSCPLRRKVGTSSGLEAKQVHLLLLQGAQPSTGRPSAAAAEGAQHMSEGFKRQQQLLGSQIRLEG